MSLKPPATLRPGIGDAPNTVTSASLTCSAHVLPQPGHDGRVAQLGTLPLVERLEDDEHRAEVGAVGLQQERHAGDGDGVRHARRLAGDLLDLGHGVLGALQRRRVGQLDVDDEPALVLLRDEAGGACLNTQ